MPEQPLLLARLVLDAQDELLRAVEHIPAPGRGGRLGRLNTPGWALAHAAATHDGWITRLCAEGSGQNAWLLDWHDRQTGAGWEHPIDTPLDATINAYREVLTRTRPYLETLDPDALVREVDLTGREWVGARANVGYFLARAVAHLFVHCGELSVNASLVRAGDLGLPGALARTSEPTGADDASLRWVAAVAADARSEFTRIAEALPAPARGETLTPRLSAGAAVVAHVALSQDTAWNARLPVGRDTWLQSLGLDSVEPDDPHPHLDWDEAMAAWGRVREHSADLVERFEASRSPQHPVGLAWTAAHLWAHTGELQAIGSLVGMPDMDLPGGLTAVIAQE